MESPVTAGHSRRRVAWRAPLWRIVAIASALALIASSAAGAVHTHGLLGPEAPADDVARAAAPVHADGAHEIEPCPMCRASVRDEVVEAPRTTLDAPPERTLVRPREEPRVFATLWRQRSAPPRAPPTV